MNSYSKYFAISNQLEKQTIPAELKLCQLEEIIIIQVRGERVLSESRLERERERERERPKRARREMRRASREIETRERVRKDDKIRHNTV